MICEFSVSAPGLLHLSTLLIGTVCVTLGFMTHLHASWVSKQEYKLCETSEHVWKTANIECPDISLETAFLIMSVMCLLSSFLWYCCTVCFFGNSKTASLFYVLYMALAALALIIAGVLYMKSAIMIANLPGPDYGPVVQNVRKVFVAALHSKNADDMKLTSQSDEQTYYQEKLITGVLTIINGVLHLMCGYMAVLDFKH